MAEQQKKLTVTNLPQILAAERIKLNKAHKEALLLLTVPHSVEHAKEAEDWFQKYEIDILTIREFIGGNPAGMNPNDGERFGKECDRLSKTAIELGGRFTQRIKDTEQGKKDRRINLATLLTITVAAPALLYNTIKARGEEFATVATVAQGALISFGLGYYYKDGVKNYWKTVANDLNPKEIQRSANFILYYAKEKVAESDISPKNIENSFGFLMYYAKEIAAEKIKPVRNLLEQRKDAGKKNGLS